MAFAKDAPGDAPGDAPLNECGAPLNEYGAPLNECGAPLNPTPPYEYGRPGDDPSGAESAPPTR